MKTLPLFLSLLLISTLAFGQRNGKKKPKNQLPVNQSFRLNTLAPAWEKDLLVPGDEDGSRIIVDMVMDQDENVIVAGHGFTTPTGHQWFAVKYDNQGNELWKAEVNGDVPGEHTLASIEVDKDDNIYLTGQMYTVDEERNIVTIKMDKNGNILWTNSWDGLMSGWDEPLAMKVAPQGGVYVTGWSEDTVYYNGNLYSNWNIILLHYDASGNLKWSTRYDGDYQDEEYAYDLQVDAAGNIYLAGSEVTSAGGFDLLAMKYDKNGKQIWKNVYEASSSTDEAFKMTLHNGIIYVTGYARWDFWEDPFLWKLDTAGSHQWIKYYGERGYGYDVKVDGEGNIYYAADIDEVINKSDFATVKYDPTGQWLWTKAHDGAYGASDGAYKLVIDNNNNIITGGWLKETTSAKNSYRAFLVKYDKEGNEQWNYGDFELSSDGNVVGLLISGNGIIHAAGVEGAESAGFYLKLNDNGTLVSKKLIKGPKPGIGFMEKLVTGENGEFFMGGDFYLNDTSRTAGILKMHGNGTEAWKILPVDSNGTTEYFRDMTRDSKGNLLLLSQDGPYGDYGHKIQKYDQSGNLLWKKVFTSQVTTAQKIKVDEADNIIFMASHTLMVQLTKLDKDGNQVFSESYDGNGSDLEVDGQGNCFISGSFRDTNNTSHFFVMKTNADGVEQWRDLPLTGAAEYIEVDEMGKVYACGYKSGVLTAIIFRYDQDGNEEWQYTGPAGRVLDSYLDSDNKLVLSITNTGSFAARYHVQKLDNAGNVDWKNEVVLNSINVVGNFKDAITNDGNGNLYHLGVGRYNARITKFNSTDGSRLDSVTYDAGTLSHRATGIDVDAQGNITAAFNFFMNVSTNATKVVRFGDGGSVGTTKFKLEEITIYPNPAKQLIRLQIPVGAGYKITITDLTGRQVKGFRTSSSVIDISDLPSGIYLLKAGDRVAKFVKE